jgi:hypothetical protein
MRHRRSGIFGWIVCAGLAAGASQSCSSSGTGVGLAQGCTINSDCDSPLICAFSRCHAACKQSRDCAAGERCVPSTAGGVCELPQESTCADAASSCATGLICASDQQCRAPCQTATQCVTSQTCMSGACFDEPDGGEPAGDDAGVSSVDGSSSSDATVETDGNAASSDAGPAGDAACVGTLPNGGCNYCPVGACANGSCNNGNHDYSCTCLSGYAGTGTKTCAVANSCLANDLCPPGYPCEPTASPGQACLGEFASWPMPDSSPGAKTAPHYSDNQDGTVTDAVTGLVWQAQLLAMPNNCGGSDATAVCTAAQAQAYCTSLRLGGHSDWRLPTKIELESLLDCTQDTPPTIANAFNNSTYLTPAYYFWTSSVYEGGSSNWLVYFDNCSSQPGGTTSTYDVRCVSGTGITPNTPADHYTIHPGTIDAGLGDAGTTEDTVSDNRTGLTWMRGFTPKMTQTAGTAYCAQLGNGFRLPTLKELLTLVDPNSFDPSIDSTVFPNTPWDWFWASTPVMPVNGNGFIVRFSDGYSEEDGATDAEYIRCVQ